MQGGVQISLSRDISRDIRVRIRLGISPLTTVRRRVIEISALPSSILFVYSLFAVYLYRLSDASCMFPNIDDFSKHVGVVHSRV